MSILHGGVKKHDPAPTSETNFVFWATMTFLNIFRLTRLTQYYLGVGGRLYIWLANHEKLLEVSGSGFLSFNKLLIVRRYCLQSVFLLDYEHDETAKLGK